MKWVSMGKMGRDRPMVDVVQPRESEQETVWGRRFWDWIMCSFPGPTKDQ